MEKSAHPQGWGKPTYFSYSSRIQKISRDKGSLAALYFASSGAGRYNNRGWWLKCETQIASLFLVAGRVSHTLCVGRNTLAISFPKALLGQMELDVLDVFWSMVPGWERPCSTTLPQEIHQLPQLLLHSAAPSPSSVICWICLSSHNRIAQALHRRMLERPGQGR